MSAVRINRFLSSCGLGSRRECEKYVLGGRVSKNGRTIVSLSEKIDIETDKVSLNGKPIQPVEKQWYIMLNKPAGYVVSREGQNQKSVFDLLPGLPKNLAYAGRLDTDSEGLLFLTTNGDLINRLAHPRYGISKVYLVTTDRLLSEAEMRRFRQGLPLEEGMTSPAQIDCIDRERRRYRIILTEGRNRQIRRMMECLFARVKDLTRVAFGLLTLGNLKQGAWRHLTRNELWKLKRDLGIALK